MLLLVLASLVMEGWAPATLAGDCTLLSRLAAESSTLAGSLHCMKAGTAADGTRYSPVTAFCFSAHVRCASTRMTPQDTSAARQNSAAHGPGDMHLLQVDAPFRP